MLTNSLSRLRCIGLYDDNDPEKLGYEYGKSIFDTDKNTVCSVASNQNVNNEFEIDDIKYFPDEKDLTNSQSQGTDTHTVDPNTLSHMCNLNPTKIKQQQQGVHVSKIADKCKSEKNNKTPYYLYEYGMAYRKLWMDQIFFYTIMVPHNLQPYTLHEIHNVLGHNGSTRLHNFIERHYYWKKLHQHCNKYARICSECQ